jgi:pyruvate dehydrogenase E1 component alpha subunit
VRAGEGPYFLEFTSYRVGPHWSGDDGSYMCPDELAAWRERDPILRCERTLVEAGIVSAEELAAVREAARTEVASAIERARALPDATYDDILSGVYAGAPAGAARGGS